ncbi:hypothetical protein [Frankia sp. Cr2]|uniref:hypothetical protein n=1 Tax=Frankia sp. Cr2 TaxID=3073932 RepID=UPI002AD3AE13|nr:hypothetical protein [Frankia sp. Cr2]
MAYAASLQISVTTPITIPGHADKDITIIELIGGGGADPGGPCGRGVRDGEHQVRRGRHLVLSTALSTALDDMPGPQTETTMIVNIN